MLITKKQGMTRIHRQNGIVCAVTILSVQEAKKVGERTEIKDGYIATIFDADGKKFECLGNDCDSNLEGLDNGQPIEIVGKTKGKGFSGTIKRYSFAQGPMSHGSHNKRQPGAVGSAYPQRVVKGQKMPGRMGGGQTTIKTVVEEVIKDKNYLLVKGSVPGKRGTMLMVKTV